MVEKVLKFVYVFLLNLFFFYNKRIKYWIYKKIKFDILNNVINFIIFWWPWLNFFDDSWIIQFLILFTFFIFYNSKNVYYSLLYFFFIIFYIGLAISIVQAELFTGFLWTTEFTIILIILILFFYLNIEGNFLKINLKNINFYYIYLFFFFLFLFSLYFFFNPYSYIQKELNWLFFSYFYNDWYEALNNILMNDFIVLTLSYYSINSIEFFLIGYLLLLGSVVCVILNKIQKNSRINNTSNFLKFFSYFTIVFNYMFFRKQTLNLQSNYKPTLRFFKKKKW